VESLLELTASGLYLVLLLAAPVIVACALVGIVVGVLQAVTQVQDPAISFAPRLVAGGLALVFAAPWIGAQLVRFTETVLAAVAKVG
jgi:flagellar biosynthetic protein FliQ